MMRVFSNSTSRSLLIATAVAAGLYAASLYSFLLFHTLIELFCVFVAFTVFVLAWNTRGTQDNRYLLFAGISSLFSGVLDLMHTLAYAFERSQGLPRYGGDLDTQLWIAHRYVSAAMFLCAPLLFDRKRSVYRYWAAFAAATVLLAVLIFTKHFPAGFVEGEGVTAFKIGSEYCVSIVYVAALGFLYRKRNAFDPGVLRLVQLSLVSAALTGLSYSQYRAGVGPANIAGHYFDLLSNWLLYRAIVVTGLVKPTNLLFRNLKQSEEALKRSEQKYRGLYDSIKEGIAKVDLRGAFIECNRAFADMLGYSPEEVPGLAYEQTTPAAWREMERDIFRRQVLVRGFSDEYEKECLRKDGTVFPVSVKIWLIRNGGGEPVAVWGLVRDITERKRTVEETLRHIEDLEFLSHTSARFLEEMSFDECFEYAADRLRAVAGRAMVAVTEYDEPRACTTVRAVRAGEGDLRTMRRVLGRAPEGLTFALTRAMKERLVPGGLTKLTGGFEELTFSQVPQELCRRLDREMNVGEIYIMPFSREDDFLGAATLFLRRGDVLSNPRIIEALINLASL